MNLIGVVLVASALVVGCATVPPTPAAQAITMDMLLEARPLVGEGVATSLPDTDILALDPQMLVFLDRFVDAKQSDYTKLRQLVYAIMDEGSFGLEYDDQTRTAAETFHLQRGNCLSFTNMFVAMARQVGIDAYYQEVDIPPDWTVEGGAFVLNRHVNVLVDLRDPFRGKRVVDFNIDDFRTSYDRREIYDRRAMAHYYNNMGVDRMLAGEIVEALLYFRKAIENDHRFSPPWGNLGTLYRRNGHLAYAEVAYLQALDVNSGDFVAMSNLADLYERQGDEKLAATYRRRVDAHRMRNPYYRYRLAREAFLAKDYDISIGHLKYSVRKKKNEDTFYFLMGMSYLKKGDESAARRWLEKAERVADDDDLQRNYHSKLETLLSPQE
jgi:tetratricopeptide (TPR) repeat protein